MDNWPRCIPVYCNSVCSREEGSSLLNHSKYPMRETPCAVIVDGLASAAHDCCPRAAQPGRVLGWSRWCPKRTEGEESCHESGIDLAQMNVLTHKGTGLWNEPVRGHALCPKWLLEFS